MTIFRFIVIFLILYSIFITYKVDVFIISIWLSFIYTYPGMIGYVYFDNVLYEIIKEWYYIFYLMYFVLFIVHLINQIIIYNKDVELSSSLNVDKREEKIYTYVYIFFLIMYLISVKGNILEYDTVAQYNKKLELFFILTPYVSIVYFLHSYINNKVIEIIFGLSVLIFFFLKGSRSKIIIALFGVLIYHLYGKKINIADKLKSILMFVPIFIIGVFGKIIYGSFQRYINYGSRIDIGEIFNTQNLYRGILQNEAFTQQGLLNLSIINEIRLPLSYIKTYLLKLTFIDYFIKSTDYQFYDIFITRVNFSGDYGVANNIFAEPYAILGMLGVAIFIIGYVLLLFMIQYGLSRCNKNISKATFLTILIYLTFFIHRNNIRNVIFYIQIYVFYLLLNFIIVFIRKKRRTKIFII